MAEIDWVGMVLQTAAFASGIIAVSFGGVVYAWNSGQTIGMFVCSGVLFVLLGFQQSLPVFTSVPARLPRRICA